MTRLLQTVTWTDDDGAALQVDLYDDGRPVIDTDARVELTRDQVVALREVLGTYLAATEPCRDAEDSPGLYDNVQVSAPDLEADGYGWGTTEAAPAQSTIAAEAMGAVYGDRQADYGHPREDFTRTAIVWTGLLQPKLADGAYIEAEDIARCMIGVKLSRDVHAPKRDNRVDGIGYLITLDRLETGK